MAKNMTFCGRYGNSCGTPFIKDEFIEKNRQYEIFGPYLKDRPAEEWTLLSGDTEKKENEDDNEEKEENDENKKKPKYKGFSKEFLACVDEHIHRSIKERPATLYENFCTVYQDAIKSEIMKFKEQYPLDPIVFSEKCKKTYKNRYYTITKIQT
jgi:hypothetical protein